MSVAPPAPTEPPVSWKVFGILNLTIGAFLLLTAVGLLASVGPWLASNGPFRLDPAFARVVAEELQRAALDGLRQEELETNRTADKERIAARRREFERLPADLAAEIDFERVNRQLPWVSRYLWADLVTAPVLNVLLLASGPGLWLGRPWGRRLAVRTAALKVARLALLSLFLAAVVVPNAGGVARSFARSRFGGELIRQSLTQVNARQGVTAEVTPAEFAEVLVGLGYGYALASFCLGTIYPASLLVVLARRPKDEGPSATDGISGPAPQ